MDWHGTKMMWVDRMLDPSCDLKTLTSPMTLTLDFQGQNFNCHILGKGRLIDLEWKRCELDTMLDAQWACHWATVHVKKIGQVMGQCETLTVSNLLTHEWAIRSLIWGLRGVVLWTPCCSLSSVWFNSLWYIVMPYGDIGMSQHWLRQWLVA